MIQIELCTNHIEENTKIFRDCFGFGMVQNNASFVKLLTCPIDGSQSELMLFDPNPNLQNEPLHWQITGQTDLGKEVEIILVINKIEEVQSKIILLGYSATPLTKKPWGSLEFEFYLKDGYLIRVKQLQVIASKKS